MRLGILVHFRGLQLENKESKGQVRPPGQGRSPLMLLGA